MITHWVIATDAPRTTYVRARLRAQHAAAPADESSLAIVTDDYGRIVHVTKPACALLAGRAERMLGKQFMHRVDGESRSVVGPALRALRETGCSECVRATMRSLRGDPIDVELELRTTLDDRGRLFVIALRPACSPRHTR